MHYNDWDGMVPHIVENESARVQHSSMPFGVPSQFPDVEKWLRKGREDSCRFVLTVRCNGVSVRSKMRRGGTTLEEAQSHNLEAARLMALIAGSDSPHMVFSYEALLFLGGEYLQELYRFLDIQSHFVPPMADANERYLKEPLHEGGPLETVRPLL